MARKRGFRVFQTNGWLPGTKISYYAQRPITDVGSQIKSQKTKRRLKKRKGW